MKKIISLLTIVFILTSCENEVKEINSTGGEILMGNNKGSVYSFGKMDDANHALNFSKAFTVKDYSFFTEENFNDTIFFYPEKGLDRLEFDIQSAIELIKSMHEPYDSCLLYTSPSPRDATLSRMPSSA